VARRRSRRRQSLELLAQSVALFSGSSTAFALAVGTVVVWLASGPFFHYSETWQLVINTGTTIVTFLMVFLIQRSQNKESLAIQLKLNELVAAIEGASNRLVNVQDLSEDELKVLHDHYAALAALAKDAANLRESHSVDEAHARHQAKAG
jgi:low affinity Fe/Cu permease